DQPTVEAPRDAGRPPHELLTTGRAGYRHHHPLARLPRVGDSVGLHVRLEVLLDAIGDPEQSQLAEGGQVPRPEVVAERGVHPLGRVDVAVRHAPAERLGAHVDQLDLVGAPDDVVGNGLALVNAGNPLDDVVQTLEVLDVDGGDDVDAGVEEIVDVLPALLVL